MSFIYECHDLKQCYDGHDALNVPEFIVENGEMIILTGPNGAGKSTLLRLLALIEQPYSGSLIFNGKAQEVTLLLQEPYLLKMNVFKNVLLGRILRHMSGDNMAIYMNSMQTVGFDDPKQFINRGPRQLSGGEKQRVAFAARLAFEPKILLLDEPTANVDSHSAKIIAKAICNARDSGTTIICATHDTALIRSLNGRIFSLGKYWDE